MSEIPGDLMSIADKMAAGFLKEGSLGCDVLAGSIARALLAERERCAEIAERFPGAVLHFSDRPYDKPSEYRAATSADIAKAIRS